MLAPLDMLEMVMMKLNTMLLSWAWDMIPLSITIKVPVGLLQDSTILIPILDQYHFHNHLWAAKTSMNVLQTMVAVTQLLFVSTCLVVTNVDAQLTYQSVLEPLDVTLTPQFQLKHLPRLLSQFHQLEPMHQSLPHQQTQLLQPLLQKLTPVQWCTTTSTVPAKVQSVNSSAVPMILLFTVSVVKPVV